MSHRYSFLAVEPQRARSTWWVTIDRRRDRNSINSPLIVELHHLLDEAEEAQVRALVFEGAGASHFVGGADGIEMMRFGPEEARDFSGRLQALFARMEASPIITVAAIDGLCFGGGFELALACDLRVAADTARIGLPEVKVGLIPGGGGTQRLPRIVGLARALELILSGRLCSGKQAAAIGLVHASVSSSELEQATERLLGMILKWPGHAVSLAKQAVHASSQGSIEDGLGVETERFSRCFDDTHFKELMKTQIQSGKLETTADLSGLDPTLPRGSDSNGRE